MTTPTAALDALSFICRTIGWLEVVPPYGDAVDRTKEADKAIKAVEIIRTVLKNAPEVVTDEDVAKLLFNAPFPSKGQLSRVKRIVDKYPHGLKITAAPNGGD